MLRPVPITTITIAFCVMSASARANGPAQLGAGENESAGSLFSGAQVAGSHESNAAPYPGNDNTGIWGVSNPEAAMSGGAPMMAGSQPLPDCFSPPQLPQNWGTGYSSGPAVPPMPYSAIDWSDNYEISASVDTLFLTRTGLEAGNFVFDGGGTPVLNFGDIDMGFQPGPRVSLLLGGRVSGLEIAGFGFNQLGDTTTVNQPGVTPVFFNGIPADPAASYDIVTTSKLYNLEGNFWCAPCSRIRLGAGLRYVNVKDKYDVIFPDSSATSLSGFFSDSDNHLYGGQLVGGLNVVRLNRLSVDITGKAGIYYNEFDLDAEALSNEFHLKTDTTSYLYELNVGFEYFLTRALSMRAGYSVFWFDEIGVAGEHSDDFRLSTGMGTFDYSNPIYQGGYWGFQLRF